MVYWVWIFSGHHIISYINRICYLTFIALVCIVCKMRQCSSHEFLSKIKWGHGFAVGCMHALHKAGLPSNIQNTLAYLWCISPLPPYYHSQFLLVKRNRCWMNRFDSRNKKPMRPRSMEGARDFMLTQFWTVDFRLILWRGQSCLTQEGGVFSWLTRKTRDSLC